jgi:Fic family protein
MKLYREYPHLIFAKQWNITEKISFYLGQCDAFVKAINNTPIMPNHYERLMNVALVKGAQATTAIEGNTLSDEEINKLLEGQKLPPSKEYQEIEVKNIIDALNFLFKEVVNDNSEQLITPDLLLRLHKMVGKELGEHFNAIPGQFRNSDVIVGKYRCPDHRDVIQLINSFCKWLQDEFKFLNKEQTFSDIVIQAIVSHIYIEWIHPFGDGNGRTGRLLEFYILLRGNSPNIASHILSNHYNLTRSEYYRQLDKAKQTNNLTEFIEYALLGFRDGLQHTLEIIQQSQFEICWQKLIYDKFADVKTIKKDVLKRRRTLALEFNKIEHVTVNKIADISIKLAQKYTNISERTILRDLEELIQLDIIIKDKNEFYPNLSILNTMIAQRRKPQKNNI